MAQRRSKTSVTWKPRSLQCGLRLHIPTRSNSNKMCNDDSIILWKNGTWLMMMTHYCKIRSCLRLVTRKKRFWHNRSWSANEKLILRRPNKMRLPAKSNCKSLPWRNVKKLTCPEYQKLKLYQSQMNGLVSVAWSKRLQNWLRDIDPPLKRWVKEPPLSYKI